MSPLCSVQETRARNRRAPYMYHDLLQRERCIIIIIFMYDMCHHEQVYHARTTYRPAIHIHTYTGHMYLYFPEMMFYAAILPPTESKQARFPLAINIFGLNFIQQASIQNVIQYEKAVYPSVAYIIIIKRTMPIPFLPLPHPLPVLKPQWRNTLKVSTRFH